MYFWRDGNMSEDTVDSWKKQLQDILAGIWTRLLIFSEPFPVT